MPQPRRLIIPGYASHGVIKADQELPTGEECQRRASEEIKAIGEKVITLNFPLPLAALPNSPRIGERFKASTYPQRRARCRLHVEATSSRLPGSGTQHGL
jgi:hypothetical protein